jgi:hypothetical protein
VSQSEKEGYEAFCFLVISRKLCDTAGKHQRELKTPVFLASRRACMLPFQSEAAPLERSGHNLTERAKHGAFAPFADQDITVKNLLQPGSLGDCVLQLFGVYSQGKTKRMRQSAKDGIHRCVSCFIIKPLPFVSGLILHR